MLHAGGDINEVLLILLCLVNCDLIIIVPAPLS
jgi:hypothetical protein